MKRRLQIKKLLVLVTLMVLVSQARGIEHLTINGEDVGSINLSLRESCTIEVVSSGGALPYIMRLHTTNFTLSDLELMEIRPEAGAGASATPVEETEYVLRGETGMVAGVHFVFRYTPADTGQKEVELRYFSPPDPFDSIVINVTPAPAGVAFMYQGRLTDGGSLADGDYDFQFQLYDDPCTNTPVSSVVSKDELDVSDGYFETPLDFGSNVFDGDARWLEIGVRPGAQTDPCAYTILEPRQEVTPTPYALQTRGIFVDNVGNVGVGTTSPSAILDVGAGAIRGSEDDVVIGDTRGSGGRAGLELYTPTKSGAITYHPTEGMKLWVDGGGGWLSAVNVLPAGNVGIGMTNPNDKLEVNGAISTGNGGICWKTFSGTLDADQNTEFAHGLDASKIIHASCSFYVPSLDVYMMVPDFFDGSRVYWDNTYIYLLDYWDPGSLAGQPWRCVVMYVR